MCFFFCKQKTAYEMRISDWSSDVCSSDLRAVSETFRSHCSNTRWMCSHRTRSADIGLSGGGGSSAPDASKAASTRSEEHTSELQSLMRISYAVFCLKKNNNTHCTLMLNRLMQCQQTNKIYQQQKRL